MLYTLSLFVREPIRWINSYEWRTLTDLEKCALGIFVKNMGDGMLIEYDNLPSSKTGFRDGIQWANEILEWSEKYEADYMIADKYNHLTANETTAILIAGLPNFLKPYGRQAVSAMMDTRLRSAMMFVNLEIDIVESNVISDIF